MYCAIGLVLTYEALAEGMTPDHADPAHHAANPGSREAAGDPCQSRSRLEAENFPVTVIEWPISRERL